MITEWNIRRFVRRAGVRPVAGAFILTAALTTNGAEAKVGFNREVRPIFADNCFACHGPDSNKRKAGLRLDTKEGIFEKTPKRDPAVVPGKLAQSELWSRITTTNLDDRMPPEESHKKLTPEQIAKLKDWIVAGARVRPIFTTSNGSATFFFVCKPENGLPVCQITSNALINLWGFWRSTPA